MSRVLRFVLVGLAVAALVTAGVVVVVSETGDERASEQEAAEPTAEPGPVPGVVEPPDAGDAPIDEDDLSIESIIERKQASAEARMSTILYEVAQEGRGRITPDEAARITRLPATGTGSLTLYDGRVVVEADMTDVGLATLAALQTEGAEILNVNERYAIVTAAVAASDLEPVAKVAGVKVLREVLGPIVGGRDTRRAAQEDVEDLGSPDDVGVLACPGNTVSEGDAQLNADDARSAYPIDGTGTKVAVISDTYNVLTASPNEDDDIASGDLPGAANPCGYTTPVQELTEDCLGTGFPCNDEGRALAQIVHDLAPGAELAFASAWPSESAFASRIDELAGPTVNADVIADDISYLAEPFFQDGPVANAVADAKAAGVTYFSSAGNSNVIDAGNGKEMGSYEAPAFREMTCPSALGLSGYVCHNFSPSGSDATLDFTVASGGGFRLNAQWSQPRGDVDDDFAVFLYSSSNAFITGADATNTTVPFEFLPYVNTFGTARDVRLVFARWEAASDGGTPRFKWIMHNSSGLSGFSPNAGNALNIFGPTVFGHNGSDAAISTAAVPYDNANITESFSSRGPVTHEWEPVPSVTPMATTTIPAPDLAATDGGQNTFFGSVIGQFHRFYGTSASVAHAAGVAALLLQADPSLDPDGVLATLQATAAPVPSGGGVNAVGAGLVDAYAAVTSRTGSVTITVDADPDGPQDFGFASNALGAELFALDDDAEGTLPNTQTFDLLAGTEYTFTQSVPDGWDLTGLTCDAGSTDLGTATATITLAPQEAVSCTYTNTQRGSITIEQSTLPDDLQAFGFTSTELGPFSLDGHPDPGGASEAVFDDLEPGTYTVSQDPVAGYPLQSITCDTAENETEPSVAVTVEPGEAVTCSFTNHRAADPGTIQVIQDSIDDHDTNFAFTSDVVGSESFELDDDVDGTLPDAIVLTPGEDGTFTVTQSAPPPGWQLTGLECTNGATVDLETATATITLPTTEVPTEGVTCIFTDTRLGSISVVQDNVPDNGLDWAFTVTGGPASIDQPFSLDDDADPALPNTQVVSDLLPGEYTVTQTSPVPGGWTFVPPSITCSNGDPTSTAARTATVTIDPGEAVTCTYLQTNRQPDGWLKSGNPGAAYIGDGIYNLDGTGQKRTMNARRGTAANFYVKIQTDGGVTDSITVKGSPSANGFTVQYYWGSKNVSGAVRNGTYTRANVVPGPPANTALRVKITPSTTVKKGVTRSILVRLTSAGSGIRDVVRAQVKAT